MNTPSPELVEKLRGRMLQLRELMLIAPVATSEGRELIGDTFIHTIIQDVLKDQQLTTAPQRGRVLFEERVDLMDYAPSHETFMYGSGPGGPECKSGEYMGAIRKRLLENPQVGVIVEGFTVTVQEAEPSPL